MKVQKRLAAVLTVPAFALSGCYVIPAGPDGHPAWPPGAVWGPGVSTAPAPAASQPASAPAPASAYSPAGSYMSCEYPMNTPLQGAGTCTFSNRARYRVHIGS